MNWTKITDEIWLFRDSCNVFAVEAAEGAIIVNAGTGRWLEHLDELPLKPVALACTHYFRDHAAGAAAAARLGIPVYVPEGEVDIFADPEQHFRQRDTYIIYDNVWDLFAPIETTPVAGVLRDYEQVTLSGTKFDVIPLPGVTLTQIGLGLRLADGRYAVFCAEAIHSPGRLARVAPLQYNYNDLGGAVMCSFSVCDLMARRPDLLLPSLGDPILDSAQSALESLRDNLRRIASVRPDMLARMDACKDEPLERVTDHVWRDRQSWANTWYLISDSGKVMALDYGYHVSAAANWPGYPKTERRRALLHGLSALKEQFGVDRIDVVLVSHFHDDHVCGIPVLQRVFGTECWAAENFADLLEHPESHCFPCNWPVTTRVDRRLPLDKSFTWEEYTFDLHPMSGHTRFASLIGFEADGKRFAHTGDQYFFNGDFQNERGFGGVTRSQNYVFRNGALNDGYNVSGEWMLRQRPDIVIQGHRPAMFTDEAFFRHIAEWPKDYAELFQCVMPLGDSDVHFGLDSWGGWIWPYRTHHKDVAPIRVRVTVRNPLPRPAKLDVRLVGVTGWRGDATTLSADSRAEVSADLDIVPSGACRRQPFAVELTVDGHCYGQVAEALATVGYDRF